MLAVLTPWALHVGLEKSAQVFGLCEDGWSLYPDTAHFAPAAAIARFTMVGSGHDFCRRVEVPMVQLVLSQPVQDTISS